MCGHQHGRDQVLGLIWLSRDGARNNRWKIDQVIVDPMASTYDVGTQLVNYVINRYGGAGVQTSTGEVFDFDPEYAWNYELSYRGKFLDNRLNLSANALAMDLHVPATRIGEIIRPEKPRAVTPDTALRLARV